jgi:hypothetical protein
MHRLQFRSKKARAALAPAFSGSGALVVTSELAETSQSAIKRRLKVFRPV